MENSSALLLQPCSLQGNVPVSDPPVLLTVPLEQGTFIVLNNSEEYTSNQLLFIRIC